jgi:hypothetical protein
MPVSTDRHKHCFRFHRLDLYEAVIHPQVRYASVARESAPRASGATSKRTAGMLELTLRVRVTALR